MVCSLAQIPRDIFKKLRLRCLFYILGDCAHNVYIGVTCHSAVGLLAVVSLDKSVIQDTARLGCAMPVKH